MEKYKIDVPVLLIFFNRPEKLRKTFEAVGKAKPSRIYLYQDGVRDGRADDIENVAQCREIASNIDWECEIHTMYQEKNFGCDPSEYIAQKWFFGNEEMGIVLEDDDVPSQTFFPYCKELLEKYKDNSEIAIICGMNSYDIEKSCNESYLFSKRGCIWGWASWRRFIDLWDKDYTWLDNGVSLDKIKKYCDCKGMSNNKFIATATRHKNTGTPHYESIMFAAASQNDMLNIVPKFNMISNVGVGGESTHGAENIKFYPKRVQELLNKKTYEIDFPLIHPIEIIKNSRFDKRYHISAFGKIRDKIESVARVIIYGNFQTIKKKLVKKFR